MSRYLFIGGLWDGRREYVPLEYPGAHFPTGTPLPRATFEVDHIEPVPVQNGPDWDKNLSHTTVPVTRLVYRRELLRGNKDGYFAIFVLGDVDVIEKLIERYRPL